MMEGPDISRVASLIGDPVRSNMLLALMDGRALSASELANVGRITKQTASSHLSRLLDGGLLAKEVQGRHHYYRLANAGVAEALEALLAISETGPGKRLRTGPNDPALRKARICYDHLAGELGVFMFDRLSASGWLVMGEGGLIISQKGWEGLSRIGLSQDQLPKTRRAACKTCLDWSVRRHHLAGSVGAMLLNRFIELGWTKRLPDSRILAFSHKGEKALRDWLG